MPRNLTLREALSRVASKLTTRQRWKGALTVIYIEGSNFNIHKVLFSTTTTINDMMAIVASHMGLPSAKSLRVIALPYGCYWHDKKLKCLQTLSGSWEASERLIESIQPTLSDEKISRSGYPKAVCLSGSNFPIDELFYPWNPVDVQFFVGVKLYTFTAATLEHGPYQTYTAQQLHTLSTVSVIRGQGGGQSSEEQKELRAAMIARYALGYLNNPHGEDACQQ
ncbi:hypothetical protein TWF506_003400 [Arthrobotrys conoides]|uniref:Uncharacterized protein n=1 Tax=Arthrobotrys conoides TaxID=74498 RepID=A0AAN8NB52_9PEZI